MFLLIVSFIAGILTVLAPCSLPLLPVILGGSLSEQKKSRPFIIIFFLSVSILIFTLLLKISFLALNLNSISLNILSGLILIVLGVFMFSPTLWTNLTSIINLDSKSIKILNENGKRSNLVSGALIGVSLGPIFTSCSPTFGYLISIIIPNNFLIGLVNLIAYILGLALVLLLISLLGQKIIKKLKWASNPNGIFRKVISIIIIIAGIFIIFKIDKQIESYLLNNNVFEQFDINKIDQILLKKAN